MLRATIKSLLARKLRLVLSALAIVLGVSFVAGAFVLTDSLGRTFDDLFATVSKNVAVDVRGTEKAITGSDEPGEAGDRQRVPAAVLDTVRRVDGVAEAQPSIVDNATIVGTDGEPVTSADAPNLGMNWVGSTTLSQLRIIEGNPPRAPDEIAIDADLSEESGQRVGATALVLTSTGQHRFRVVGISEYENGRASLGGETYVLFSTATAQKVLDYPGTYSDIQLAARDGVSQEELRDRVAAALPAGTEAITGQQLADESASDVQEGLGFLNTFLLVFAGVALFVGAFIIFNTFSILIAQRTRELALLRALGARKRQVTRSVLVESVVVGTIASALGLGLGIGVALGLKALFDAFGAGLPDGPTLVLPRTVVVSFAVGILITVIASLVPARRAAKIPPVAAMREAATPDRSLTRLTIGGVVVLAAGSVCMFFGLTGSGLAILGVGTLLAFVGVALLSPLVSRPVSRLVGMLFARRLPGRLGRQNALRNPRRTASTAAALMIGLALVSAVGVLGASLNKSIHKVVNGALGADFVLDTQTSGITPEAFADLRQRPGVAAVDGLYFEDVMINGTESHVIAIPPTAIGGGISLQREQGSLDTLGPGSMLVSDDVLTDKGWQVGDSVELGFTDGFRSTARIGGSYEPNELVGDYVLDQSGISHFDGRLAGAALVTVAPDADSGQVRQELEAAIAQYPNIDLLDRSGFIKQATDEIDQVVQFLSVLLVLSVLIAVLGIINTLALSVLERTRELGLLRAVGMSRRQVKRMVRVESVIIAVFGGLLGLLVGSAFGLALQRALVGEGVTELAFPVGQLLAYLVLAAVAGVLAAWLPARRASRLNVLGAIATE